MLHWDFSPDIGCGRHTRGTAADYPLMLKPGAPRNIERTPPKVQRPSQLIRYGPISAVPSLRKLQYLLAVAQELHFRKAAEKLHVSQPVVSRQVRQCEEDLGFRILERDHHYVALTRAGRMFVTDLGRILRRFEDDLDKSISRAAETSHEAARQYVVGHSPFMALHLRRIALDIAREDSLGSRLRLRILPTKELLKAIKSQNVLAGITYAPIPDADMEIVSIEHEYWAAVVASKGHFGSHSTAKIEEFREQPIISHGADRTHPALNRRIREQWAAVGFLPRTIADVTSPHEAFYLVRGGVGIALLPEGVCEDLPRGVRAIRIIDLPPLETILVCRSADVEFAHAFGERLRHFVFQRRGSDNLAWPKPRGTDHTPVGTQKAKVKGGLSWTVGE